MVFFFALGLPIAIAILAASIGGMSFFTPLPLILVAQRLMTTLDSFPLMAIPFFILAGNLMEAGGISAASRGIREITCGRRPGRPGLFLVSSPA